MAINTLETLPAESKTFYERTLLKNLKPNLVFTEYGQKKTISKNNGKTIEFRKVSPLAIPTKPLTEGVTPEGSNLTVTTITATVEQFGDFIETSDMLELAGIDPNIVEKSEVLGDQAGLTIDTNVRDIITSGTNVQYAGGAASADTIAITGVLDSKEIKKAVRTLRNANAKPIDGRSYIGIIDPSQEYDIMSDPLFIDANKYAHSEKIFDGEVGKLQGVRFVTTTNVKTYANGASTPVTIHCAMIIGKDAYGVVDIAGSSKPQIFVKQLGSSGTSDPINQRATIGWKAGFKALRLNELAMVRVETAATV